jgi:hypothetical protein
MCTNCGYAQSVAVRVCSMQQQAGSCLGCAACYCTRCSWQCCLRAANACMMPPSIASQQNIGAACISRRSVQLQLAACTVNTIALGGTVWLQAVCTHQSSSCGMQHAHCTNTARCLSCCLSASCRQFFFEQYQQLDEELFSPNRTVFPADRFNYTSFSWAVASVRSKLHAPLDADPVALVPLADAVSLRQLSAA